MNVMGPLARSATDLDLALSIIAEPVVGEDVAWHLMFPPVRHTALADFRIAVLPPVSWLPVDGEILAALEDLTARLRRFGALVEMVQPEGFDLRQHHEAYSMLLSVIAFAHLDDDERAHVVELLQQSSDLFANAHMTGVNATVSQFIGMHGRRGLYRALFREFFRNFDVLLAPVTITPAFPHISDQVPVLKRTLQVNGTAVPYMYLPIYAGVAAYSGLPATIFPWGQTRGGLPIGLQAIGPYLEDHMTIAFASLLEREFGGFMPPPGYHRSPTIGMVAS